MAEMSPGSHWNSWIAAFCIAACATGARGSAPEAPAPDFGRLIQPILAENCFQCHGPDAGARQADLRLDTADGALAAGVIVQGDSAASRMIARVLSDDPDQVMPPPASNLTLTNAQKELLRQWVDAGAEYSRHWAFVPPVRPAVPATPPEATIRNPIDAFVVARLTSEGLSQAPEAEPARLLRRVSLDLTGLPPTPEELNAFLSDASHANGGEGAYERAVIRLLDSPRYGERMVWEWLDAARYADTNGYQGDPTRAMWYWRDWAIAAFNRNQPFDQFTLEQLAGDLLPDPTREQLIATGFHRNHMINGEGGRIAEESRVEYVQDRVETTGTVWMGLTLTCCRCHDHKFDPFTQREYYQLAAYFNSIDETGANDAGGLANPILAIPTPEQQAAIDGLKAAEQTAQVSVDSVEQQARGEQAAWEASLVAGGQPPAVEWLPLLPTELSSEQGATLNALDDGSVRADGASPDADDYVLRFADAPAGVTALRLEALPDEALVNGGPGRADNGNFVLSELTLLVGDQPVELVLHSADFAQPGWDAAGAIDGNPGTGWAVASEFGKPHTLVVMPKTPLPTEAASLTVRLAFKFGQQHTLGRFRLSASSAPPELLRLPDGLRAILAVPAAERNDEQRQQLATHFLDAHPAVVAARQQRDAARKARADAEGALPRTMVMRERAEPRETFILAKGAYNAPGEKVTHGLLTDLAPPPADAPMNRLSLARWLIAPEHPLTARVTVNRFWQQFFGIGLVKSSEDFGIQGDKPSHPELLDWLAVDFRESGWDVKRLVRMIVTSATYRQSSRVPPGMSERDPGNRLLARGPRYRLPSWMLRDQALAVGGLLVERVGGPPVKGYQPPGVWEDATFGQIRYEQEHGEALYRRSLYTFWRRIVSPTIFFDVANRQNCSVRMDRTNTPLHALVTLNDVTFVEAARGLAQRTLLDAALPDDAARVNAMFGRCVSRPARSAELDRLLARLALLRQRYGGDEEAARKLLAVGESPADASLPAGELAAWTGVALLLLNLDETITKE
jgi:mono/diheme cytochrome c family protein